MREKQAEPTKKSIKYDLLNDMSTEDLKSLIKQDCFGSEEDELDDNTTEMILDIISQREPEEDINIDALWETFVTEYMPYKPIAQQPSPPDPASGPCVVALEPALPKKPLRAFRYILAAALICLLLGNCVAFASGMSLFEYIARWTEDTFQFVKIEGTSSNEEVFFDLAGLDIPEIS